MSKSEQSVYTLHINLANIDAIADLLYQLDGTGDITALDCHTLMNTAATIQKLSNECEEAVSELESICHKHDTDTTLATQEETDPSVKVEQNLCLCHALDNYVHGVPEAGIVGAIEDAAKVLGEMLGAMEVQS